MHNQELKPKLVQVSQPLSSDSNSDNKTSSKLETSGTRLNESILTTQIEVLRHATDGFHSGIPWCCIKFFCERIALNEKSIAFNVAKERGEVKDYKEWFSQTRIKKEYAELKLIGIDHAYVRCDDCFRNNHWVKIKTNGVVALDLMKLVPGSNAQ